MYMTIKMNGIEPMPVKYYVSVDTGAHRALLLGPFDEHEQALALVDKAREWMYQIDPFSHFYAYGTASINPANSRWAGRQLPLGKLNYLLENHA